MLCRFIDRGEKKHVYFDVCRKVWIFVTDTVLCSGIKSQWRHHYCSYIKMCQPFKNGLGMNRRHIVYDVRLFWTEWRKETKRSVTCQCFVYFQYYEVQTAKMNVTYEEDHVSNVTDTRLLQFYKTYAGVHGYVSVCVCLFGFVTNMFNVTGTVSLKLKCCCPFMFITLSTVGCSEVKYHSIW